MGTELQAHKPPVHPGGLVDGLIVTYHRDLIIQKRIDFEVELFDWIAGYVSRSRVMVLIDEAKSDIDAIFNHVQRVPVSMQLPTKGGVKWQVFAHLLYGFTAKNGWWVHSVGFSIIDRQENITAARKAAYRDQLEERAFERSLKRPPPGFKLYFDHSQWFGPEITKNMIEDAKNAGKSTVQQSIDVAHQLAKRIAPVLENPIGPDMNSDADILKETGKAILGAAAEPGEFLDANKRLVEAYTAVDGGTKIYDNAKTGSGWKAAGDVTDLSLALVGGGPISGFGSVIIGSFLEIGIASDAGRIAKIRGRLYWYFVCGVLSMVVMRRLDQPSSQADKRMFELGTTWASRLSPRSRYIFQFGLLDYVATHNVTNSWSFQDTFDKGWVFPSSYEQNWSPEILAQSLMWQFGRKKYLIE